VVSDFSRMQPFSSVQRNLFAEVGSAEPLKVDLQETICLAATRSKLGDLVDAERLAVGCQSDDCYGQMLNLILAGQSLELRNQDAARAGQLFLKLVETQFQRELIRETEQELAGLQRTLDKSAEAGFATADGRQELASRRNALDRSESELNANEQRLQYELNHLFGFEQDSLRPIHPVFELIPEFVPFDAQTETDIAESNRPGILSFEAVLDSGADADSLIAILGQTDPRLGIKNVSRQPESFSFGCRTVIDPTTALRQNQVQSAIESLRRDARIQASEALLRIQSSYEQLALIAENVERLTNRIEQLESGMTVFNGETFLEIKRTWGERQQARSEMITQAIENEIGKLKLLEAQGRLLDQCSMADACIVPMVD
jgi:hypothetical protein